METLNIKIIGPQITINSLRNVMSMILLQQILSGKLLLVVISGKKIISIVNLN